MNLLTHQIAEEIKRNGPMPFARFMELALYAPGLGYYERHEEIGTGGDFFTSVSVGSVFGELLAFQFARWIEAAPNVDRIQLVEAGSHRGTLASDILGWMAQWESGIFERLEYVLLEFSPRRRDWQRQSLRAWESKIKWLNNIGELESPGPFRIIFSNELLDALPVHRLSWNADVKDWKECFVACDGEQFVWILSKPTIEFSIPAELTAVLPDGYIVEYCPAAEAWWRQATKSLSRGKLMTIDYGKTSLELLQPERSAGTLRAFRRHHIVNNILGDPGECDLTTDVNFTAVERAGHGEGLKTDLFTEQGRFLTQIFSQTQSAPNRFPEWTPDRIKQFKTLTHPEHLGHRFRVLVQSRNA